MTPTQLVCTCFHLRSLINGCLKNSYTQVAGSSLPTEFVFTKNLTIDTLIVTQNSEQLNSQYRYSFLLRIPCNKKSFLEQAGFGVSHTKSL